MRVNKFSLLFIAGAVVVAVGRVALTLPAPASLFPHFVARRSRTARLGTLKREVDRKRSETCLPQTHCCNLAATRY